ncbi:hypothetical protein PHAVU_001G055400 [Phaseolus vulgaris]|uniref:B-like cyclin n=1 Tax=Phaseolus vulgaris TaxID=3885 RepID=V7CV56_PHAVU|nr:hypothetical protein PHAVU_001G055400g [Phaseolus vulgaris]XP_007161260.1 hypothetical protein PHAVU_001G055400g [Phaseolus vulgaris]ESW33253.1 hypothetical protein PHAVU_001G055400g [Phaseolus vulgaris]ESW33254.1 hypothetical protein PHAVU_001G055400g [Phaseolus vulgaris]
MMDKENAVIGGRVTRAMARALREVSASSRPCFKKQRKSKLEKSSRAALTDVTNEYRKPQLNNSAASNSQTRGGHRKPNTKGASNVSMQVLSTRDVRAKSAKDLSAVSMVQSHDVVFAERLEDRELVQPSMSVMAGPLLSMQDSVESDELLGSPNKDIDMISEKLKHSDGLGIVDIDSVELKDPQVWSSYAPDIYNNIFVREFEKRLTDYMGELQKDITPSMRAILIDWLVEVSEEYKLVPDTLYLTVNLIDRFLSQSLIQKQGLQLLGVTCMLIASKYEEICAPRVEEFCFITDNTYTKAEVLRMESEVLNLLHFQLSVPTAKTFLRRFILAAQYSCKVSYVEVEFLANYLAELTLVEYSFSQFRPSLVAASAVLIARWTLNQSEHPWNSTMEHYTNYRVSELKTTVLALADLQLNTKGCPLNAIRDKYKQQKFMSVANLSPKPVQSLFEAEV